MVKNFEEIELEVSLIIPAHNRHKFINRSIRSALSQIVDFNYEVIVIDDGSIPPLSNVISHSLKERIKLVEHKKNQGLPSALNTGIKNSLGMYIVRLDSDDYLSQHYLNVLKLALDYSSKKYYAKCDYTLIENDKTKIVSSRKNPIGCGIMFRSEQLFEIGLYNEKMKMAEDEDLEKRLQLKGYKALHIPISLYRYVKHANNMSNNQELHKLYREKIIRDY